MASTSKTEVDPFCGVCRNTSWVTIPDELGGVIHHRSRKALEESATKCPLCAMILRAAIANCDAGNEKEGEGRWRYFRNAMIKGNVTDPNSEAQPTMIIRDLGALEPEVFQDAQNTMFMPKSAASLSLIRDFMSGMLEKGSGSMSVVAYTRSYTPDDDQSKNAVKGDNNRKDGKEQKEKVKEVEKRSSRISAAFSKLKIKSNKEKPKDTAKFQQDTAKGQQNTSEELPVWIYGNCWGEYDPAHPNDVSRSKKRLMGFGARFGTSHRIMDAVNNPPGEARVRGSFVQIYTDDDSPLANLIPSRIPERDASSELSFRRLQAWLHSCQVNHPLCTAMMAARERKLPTRVIDVYSPTTTADTVSVYESNGQVADYIALSHTWGTSPRLRATKANIQDLRRGISVLSLPKTFRDAVRITRRLSIRYLWIDCLCIIQDDAQDWEREAASMASIYRHAHVTISASASSDSTSGCFPVRDKNCYLSPAEQSMGLALPADDKARNQCTISYDLGSGQTQLPPFSIRFIERWLPGSIDVMAQDARIGTFGHSLDPISKEPLSTRGWTMQERLLSSRIVHYATDQLYFECETELISECGFKIPNTQFSLVNCLRAQVIPFKEHGINARGVSFVVGKAPGVKGSRRHQHGWLSLVENYSRRRLTVANDKLLAVAGVARVIAEETGDRYLAGLWAEHLQEDMFWRVQTHEEYIVHEAADDYKPRAKIGPLISQASRPDKVRAPSWSWAAIDAPVQFIPLSYSNLLCQLRSCFATATGADEYGTVSGGYLDIEAPVFEVKRHTADKVLPNHGMPVYIDFDDKRGRVSGTVHLDLPQEGLPEPCYALFLDPANAIIIRSQNLSHDTTPPKPKRILCTTDLAPAWRNGPRGSTIVWLRPGVAAGNMLQIEAAEFQRLVAGMSGDPVSLVDEINHVIRVGVGSFAADKDLDSSVAERPVLTKAMGPKDDNEASDGLMWGTVKQDGVDVQVGFNSEDVRAVGGGQSWGVVTLDDARVPISIR